MKWIPGTSGCGSASSRISAIFTSPGAASSNGAASRCCGSVRRHRHALFPGLEPDARAGRALSLPSHGQGSADRRPSVGETVFLAAQYRGRRASIVGNPPGSARPQAAKVKDLRWSSALATAVRRPDPASGQIDQPDILLVRDESGRTNWDSGSKTPTRLSSCRPSGASWSMIGHVRIDDAVRKLHFTGTVNSEENRAGFATGPPSR